MKSRETKSEVAKRIIKFSDNFFVEFNYNNDQLVTILFLSNPLGFKGSLESSFMWYSDKTTESSVSSEFETEAIQILGKLIKEIGTQEE
jgi:hypothetical protein